MTDAHKTQPIILVDDEKHLRQACTQAFELADLSVQSFPSAAGVLDSIHSDWPGVVVTDIRMPDVDGLTLMSQILQLDASIPVILISGHGDVPIAVQAMRDGAYDFLEKPFPSEVLVDAVRRAMEKRRLVLDNRRLREALGTGNLLEDRVLGSHPHIVALRQQILDLCEVQADVLINGETGVGKELVARSLHAFGQRQNQRFVAINCGSLPVAVFESELFGHEQGAFAGATEQRIGKFEYANGGTLFLDEIESMPMELQIKLLRVLQDRVIVRLGSNQERPIDVRIIAASKTDLLTACNAGHFREDLFYRLNVLSLQVPPLRERREDIPLLFQAFLNQRARLHDKQPPPVDADTLAALVSHDWPGNLRELQNIATRFLIGLPHEVTQGNSEALNTQGSLADKMNAFEKQLIQSSLAEHHGSLKATYEALGVSRKTLYDKIQKHGLQATG